MEDYTSASAAGWASRIALAALSLVTLHYIGFFSSFTGDYVFLMSTTLVARVAWQLASTVALTTLVLSAVLLVTGIAKGTVLAVANTTGVETREATSPYKVDPVRIGGLYLAVLAVTYFPSGSHLHSGLLWGFVVLFLLAATYFVLRRRFSTGSGWSRIVAPFRHRELGVRALIAVGLFVAYFSGQGLALRFMAAEPSRITTESGEFSAVILDASPSGLLVLEESGVALLPMHTIEKVHWE